MTPIKLGKKYESCNPCCSTKDSSDNIMFPSVYLSNLKKLSGLPRAGVISFRYELVRTSEDIKHDTSDLCLDLLQILDFKSDAKAAEKLTTEDALDKLRDEVVDSEESEPTEGGREKYVEDEDEE